MSKRVKPNAARCAHQAYVDGAAAFRKGAQLEDNPHDTETEGSALSNWEKGYIDACHAAFKVWLYDRLVPALQEIIVVPICLPDPFAWSVAVSNGPPLTTPRAQDYMVISVRTYGLMSGTWIRKIKRMAHCEVIHRHVGEELQLYLWNFACDDSGQTFLTRLGEEFLAQDLR